MKKSQEIPRLQIQVIKRWIFCHAVSRCQYLDFELRKANKQIKNLHL